MPTYEVEQHIIAATQHILKALEASSYVNDDFRRALRDIDSHLSTMSIITESKGRDFIEIEEQLKCAETKITRWKLNPSLIWESGPVEATEYLEAVNQILMVIESLRSENGKAMEIASRAQSVLQVAMTRLEEELCHILIQHKKYFQSQHVSFRSPAEVAVYDESFTSVEDKISEETSQKDTNDRESTVYTVDLIDPHVIPHIKSIAHVMSASNHVQEFCEAFIGVRREALYEYLSFLEIEKCSIEDVLNLEWDCLDSEIKKWVQAMKIIVRVYLASEKRLCDQILMDFGSANSICFVEISKDSILYLLNFGQAVAMGSRRPEKLLRLLEMYEVVADLHLEMDSLFAEDEGSLTRIEFHELLRRLGDASVETFLEFRTAILHNTSIHPFPGGGIHHLTRYVMNYMKVITEYSVTLNLLLKDQNVDDPDAVIEVDNDGQDICSSSFCPMACYLRSMTSTLESNLIDKSKLYQDDSLQHVFLLNNIHYMVQKVKDSKLRFFFGDEWIRRHNGKFQQHANSYVRATWSSVISMLRDDRTAPKERCRRFSNAFDEIYRTQTRWLIHDIQLREDLQISISQQVIPAYRNFLGNNNSNVSEKHVKYTAHDLEKLLLDLFVGSPRSLRNSRRR